MVSPLEPHGPVSPPGAPALPEDNRNIALEEAPVARSRNASRTLVALIVAAACLAMTAHAYAISVQLYLMNDTDAAGEDLFIVNVADVQHLGTSAISVGAAIHLDSQLAGDYRSVNVLANGRLVVETAGTQRLSYWSAAGAYDSGTGQFGGGQSWGVTPLYGGGFLSHRGSTDQVDVFATNSQTSPSYTLTLRDPSGAALPNLGFHDNQITARRGGGFYAVADRFNAYEFNSVGDAAHTTLNATKIGAVNTGNTSHITPLAGGWGGTHSDNRWVNYPESSFAGSIVSGPAGLVAQDIAPVGEDFTAVLYLPGTTGGNSRLVFWDNLNLASPLRTFDLGFVTSSSAYTDLAGPLELSAEAPEPVTMVLVGLSLGSLGCYTRRRIRKAA